MKKILFVLAFVYALSITLYSSTSVELFKEVSCESDINYPNNEKIEFTLNWYSTTAVTRNSYGQNYSMSVRVYGNKLVMSDCIHVQKVEVSSGGGWSSVRHSSVYGEDCTYSFREGGTLYYFSI